MPKKVIKTIEKTPSINIANILAIIILIGLVGLGGGYLAKHKAPAETSLPSIESAQTISYDCGEGQIALDILKEQAEVKTQDSELGAFVDTVNGTGNGDGSFWIYYVNGEMGQVGADQYKCQTGDKVEWRFEKLM